MKRVLSGSVLLVLTLLGVIYATPICYMVGIGIIGTACLYEYFGLTRAMGIRVQPWFGYFAFWILLVDFHYRSFPIAALLSAVLLILFLSALWRYRQPVQDRAFALMAEILGILYCVLFLYPAIPLRYDYGYEAGMHWTLLLLIVICTGDTAALVFGKTIGKTPFAPILSPKKTYEGAIGGLFSGIVAAIAAQQFLFRDLPFGHVVAVSILIGIFGQLGDLAESMLKRAANIKDSSHLIPGHGGALDRVDSLLFAIPVLYIYLSLLYS